MTIHHFDRAIAVVYATVCLLVVLAPAVAVRWATVHGGLGDLDGVDLVVASSLIGTGHAVVAYIRLRDEERTALRRLDMWIASLNALVVLALGATLLIVQVLTTFADEHQSLANRGYPVVALWAGVQLVAVALAEATGRLVFWWLEPHPPVHLHIPWNVMPPLRRRARHSARVRQQGRSAPTE
jgi:hypothetical protein